MDCQEYLARFSEYRDGRVDTETSVEMEVHRSGCVRCARYSETVEAGIQLLRSLPPIDVPGDFRPRLNHRILHVADGAAIARQSLGTGATTVSVLAVAILVAVSAWAPLMSVPSPTVDLPPVMAGPPPASFPAPLSAPTFSRNVSIVPTTEFRDGIWGDPHQRLREYSPLSHMQRGGIFMRTGIQ